MATTVDRRVEELATTQHGLFTTRQVLLLGGSASLMRHRVSTGRWIAQARGLLRLVGAPVTERAVLMGLTLSGGGRVVVSHRCAAALHGLRGFSLAVPEVTTAPDGRVSLAARQHETSCLPDHHRVLVDGIPCTSVARTLLDLSAVLRPKRTARAIDDALGRRWVTYGGLVGVLLDLRARGRRRTAVFRCLIEERGPLYVPPESELEARFLELCERHRIPPPRRQVVLGDDAGPIGRVDFLWPDPGLVVEVDGVAYHSALLDRRADERRDRRLTALGLAVLRFGWGEVVDRPHTVVEAVRSALGLPASLTFRQ